MRDRERKEGSLVEDLFRLEEGGGGERAAFRERGMMMIKLSQLIILIAHARVVSRGV